MICKKCGAEILEDAKFCKHCGARVEIDPFEDVKEDEKKCTLCGTINNKDAKFCKRCGRNLVTGEGGVIPQTPFAGTYGGGNGTYTAKTKEERKEENSKKVDKVSHILSLCVAGAIAFFSLLGVLSLGVNASGCSTTSTFISIYELLGRAFTAMQESTATEYVQTADMIGNVILAITIIAALLIMVELTVRFIIKMSQLSRNNGEGIGSLAIEMYLTFAVATYIISSLVTSSTYQSNYTGYGIDYSTSSNLSFATSLFLIYLISRAVERRREFRTSKGVAGKRVAGIVCLFLGLVISLGIMSDLSGAIIQIDQGWDYLYGGFLGILQYLKLASVNVYEYDRQVYASWSVYGIIINTVMIVMLALVAYHLAQSIDRKKSSKYAIIFSGVSAGLSVALMVILLTVGYQLREILNFDATATVHTLGVTVLVNCLLMLTMTIVSAAVGGFKLDVDDEHIVEQSDEYKS